MSGCTGDGVVGVPRVRLGLPTAYAGRPYSLAIRRGMFPTFCDILQERRREQRELSPDIAYRMHGEVFGHSNGVVAPCNCSGVVSQCLERSPECSVTECSVIVASECSKITISLGCLSGNFRLKNSESEKLLSIGSHIPPKAAYFGH